MAGCIGNSGSVLWRWTAAHCWAPPTKSKSCCNQKKTMERCPSSHLPCVCVCGGGEPNYWDPAEQKPEGMTQGAAHLAVPTISAPTFALASNSHNGMECVCGGGGGGGSLLWTKGKGQGTCKTTSTFNDLPLSLNRKGEMGKSQMDKDRNLRGKIKKELILMQ